jgi:ribokinase
VTLVGRAGEDAAAQRALAGFERHGVRARLALDPDRPTGTCVVLVGPDGERSMLPDPGANAALSPADLPADAFARGAHLHLTGYALLRDGAPAEAAREALRRARTQGMTISVDPSSAAPLEHYGPDRFLRAAGHPDVLLPNRDEAAVLSGDADPGTAARALAAQAREVVVTLGAEGALWSDGRVVLHAAAATAAAMRDTTGAGDAFAAGFLAAWLQGAAPGAALERGNALAARALRP